jgi:hypothetical protein
VTLRTFVKKTQDTPARKIELTRRRRSLFPEINFVNRCGNGAITESGASGTLGVVCSIEVRSVRVTL